MGKQLFNRTRKILGIALIVLFVTSMLVAVVSAQQPQGPGGPPGQSPGQSMGPGQGGQQGGQQGVQQGWSGGQWRGRYYQGFPAFRCFNCCWIWRFGGWQWVCWPWW